MSSFKHILVPVDFGDATQPALDQSLALARAFEAEITLVHAFDIDIFASAGSPFVPTIDFEPTLAGLERELRALSQKMKAQWPRTDAILRRGNVYDSILAVAKERGCDLIVIGTHGRRGLAHALLGSVAEKVVRLAPIPVLTVHPAPAAASRAA